ncbi:MAG: hypothetical protein WD423_11475 [Rhodothermales bacterium]
MNSDVLPIRSPDELARADSIVSLLQQIDEEAMRAAYEELSTMTFIRHERTEQLDADGGRIAYQERRIHHEPGGIRIVELESAGDFDFGYARRFLGRSDEGDLSSNLPDYVFPEDPAYAQQRSMEAYDYEVRDTTLNGRSVFVVSVRALPGVGDRQSIRGAQVFVDPSGNRLVGIRIDRRDAALWFREETSLFMSVRELPSGAWLPHETRFETLIHLPFRPVQRFRSVTSYSGFKRAA